jgi:hypothetical protein
VGTGIKIGIGNMSPHSQEIPKIYLGGKIRPAYINKEELNFELSYLKEQSQSPYQLYKGYVS